MNMELIETSDPGSKGRADPSIYVVIDPEMNAKKGRSVADAVKAALDGGATMIQIRDKKSNDMTFLRYAEEAVKAAKEHPRKDVPIIINDRPGIAMLSKASGVHVGKDDLDVAVVRRLVPSDFIIGATATTADEARKAAEQGADYVSVGAVYKPKSVVDVKVIGTKGLESICKLMPKMKGQNTPPVIGYGGITFENVDELFKAGADGAAVISEVSAAPDAKAATQRLALAIKHQENLRKHGQSKK